MDWRNAKIGREDGMFYAEVERDSVTLIKWGKTKFKAFDQLADLVNKLEAIDSHETVAREIDAEYYYLGYYIKVSTLQARVLINLES